MSQLESSPALSWDGTAGRGKALVLACFLVSGVLAAGALVVTTGDGARAASELVMRFSSLLFVCSVLAAPLARIFPSKPLSALEQMSGSLRMSFVAAFVFSLACILMPAAVAGEALSASAALYIVLNGLVLLVMLFPANRTVAQRMSVASWRAIQLIATAYFWLSFLVSALVHIGRQNDGTVWYPFVLTLLLASLAALIGARFCGERVSSH